jgi:hypothetical protein
VQLKEDRATIQCHHKDWGQTSLVLSLDPHIVDNLQVFSEMGALKEQGIKKIMAAQIEGMNKAFDETLRLKEENKVNEEASFSKDSHKNIKEKLKKASIAFFIPDMMKRHADSALTEVLTQYASTPVSTPESALLQEETFQNMKKKPESKALTIPKQKDQKGQQRQKAPVQQRGPALMQKTQAPPQKNVASSALKKDMKQQGLAWMLGASAGAGALGSLGLFTTLFS